MNSCTFIESANKESIEAFFTLRQARKDAKIIMAGCMAVLLGLCPKFGAIIQSIPKPVLGGVTLILYGLIAIMGVRIWIDAKVDFSDHRNLVTAGSSIIAATGLGIKGLTIAGVNIAGIAFGTLLALVVNLALSLGKKPKKQLSDAAF